MKNVKDLIPKTVLLNKIIEIQKQNCHKKQVEQFMNAKFLEIGSSFFHPSARA